MVNNIFDYFFCCCCFNEHLWNKENNCFQIILQREDLFFPAFKMDTATRALSMHIMMMNFVQFLHV